MALNECLNKYYESKIKINQEERLKALGMWENVVEDILEEVKLLDPRFSMKLLYTGSFYERVKTELPDEFDLMLVLDNVKVKTNRARSERLFKFVRVDGTRKNLWTRDKIVADDGRLSAQQIRCVFSRLVNSVLPKIQTHDRHLGKEMKASTHGPAVTLTIKVGNEKYDVDLTLAIKLPEWPKVAKSWKTRQRPGSPCYDFAKMIPENGCHVVAKQPSTGDKSHLWRLSFSEAEKSILNNIDSGISNSCRKRVLQILKAIISNDPQLQSVPLTSYFMKTLIFWESERHSSPGDWEGDKIGKRFLSAVKRLLKYNKRRILPHYFVPNVNLMQDFEEDHFLAIGQKFEKILQDPVCYFRPSCS